MQLSLQTLALLARSGDTQAGIVMDQYESHSPTTPVEIYYQGEQDVYLLHTPTMAVHDHMVPGSVIPRRPYTLTGMPIITIVDSDGGCDEDD